MATFIRATKLAELLRSADPEKKMYVRVLEHDPTKLGVGADPLRPSSVIDLSKETVGPWETDGAEQADIVRVQQEIFSGSKIARRGGEYWFEIRGKRSEHSSLRQLLAEALKALEKVRPGTLDSLSHVRGRSRRIVARDANQLFDKPHLVKEYAESLSDGWFFGTNNSARETGVWLQRAAECAGLKPGTDFKTNV